MALKRISDYASATPPLVGTEMLEIETAGGVSQKCTVANIVGIATVADGDKGDITVSSSGTAWAIDSNVVSNAKLADVATQTIKGRTTAASGDPEDLTAAQAAAVVQGDGLTTDLCGYRGIPQVSFSTNTTIAATHHGKCLYHPASDANARTVTIDSNTNLALPVGFTFSVINETSQAVSLAITTDTLVLGGTGTTGTRTLAQYAVATVTKVTSTRWYVTGAGVA